MIVRSGVLALALILPASPAAGQDYTHPKAMGLPTPGFERPDPDRLRLALDNDLVAYVAEDHRAPLVTLVAFVAAGSGHGAPGEAAVLAEALRRGPASMSDSEFRAALADMAAEYSVALGREETEITLDVPAGDAWEALGLLAAVLREPTFSGPETGGPARTSQTRGIDWERSIAGAIAAFDSRLWQGHPFGRTPTDAEMQAATTGGAQRLHGRYFVPSNVTLAVAGHFELAEARRRTADVFSSWTGGDRPAPVTFPAVTTSAPRRVLMSEADKLQGWVVIGHEIPVVPREDRAALEVMDYILGAYHLDSRLFRESRELRGLTNDNSSFLEFGVRGPGAYTFRTYGRPETVRLLVDVTFRELDEIRDRPATEDEIFVAKGALVDGLYASRYSTGLDATQSYAQEWLREAGHDWSEGYPERIRAVTPAQVQAAARSYIHPERVLISVVGPLERIRRAPAIEAEPQLDAWGRVGPGGSGGR
jgi:predicted Zn-dependent peptidase